MEQLFDVLGPVAILVFIAIGKLIETVFKGKGDQRPSPSRRPSRPPQKRPASQPSGGDGDVEDVQERIRRLIMERAGIDEDPEPKVSYEEPEPEPDYYEPVVEEPRRPLPPPPKPPLPKPVAQPDAFTVAPKARKSSVSLRKLGLGTKEDLRKAIVQREILGPPLALRENQNEQW